METKWTRGLPSIEQIDRARTPLETAAATGVAAFYMAPYAPQERTDAFRRLYLKNLRDAARALGLELVRRSGPQLAVDNTEPNTMREVQ